MTHARVLLVGAGYFAAFHAQAWRALGATLAGVVDRDAERARTGADAWGAAFAETDLDRALDRARPTLVDVVLPPAAQRPVVEAALQRGLPTLCQKPFGTDLGDAQAMVDAAARARAPLVVHENFRFAPWFRECRRLVDQGFFGRLHGMAVRLRPGDGQGPEAYLDRQPYFQRMPRLLVRETGIHFVDTFRFLLGEVRAVTAHLRRLNPVIAGEDAALVHFEFDDLRSAVFDGNRLNESPAADPRRTLCEAWLEGEAGVMRLDGDGRLWWKPQGRPEAAHAYLHDAPGPFGGAVAALQAHVLAHLSDGAPLHNAAADYLQNLRVESAIYESHASGRRIALAPPTPEAA